MEKLDEIADELIVSSDDESVACKQEIKTVSENITSYVHALVFMDTHTIVGCYSTRDDAYKMQNKLLLEMMHRARNDMVNKLSSSTDKKQYKILQCNIKLLEHNIEESKKNIYFNQYNIGHICKWPFLVWSLQLDSNFVNLCDALSSGVTLKN